MAVTFKQSHCVFNSVAGEPLELEGGAPGGHLEGPRLNLPVSAAKESLLEVGVKGPSLPPLESCCHI